MLSNKTNADRIRSMTDDELVVFLEEFSGECVFCERCDGHNDCCEIHNMGERYCSPKDIKEWLQKSAGKERNE